MSDQLLPKSIEIRALAHMDKGADPVEAVKLAIEEENNTIWLCMGVDMKTGQHRPDIAKKVVNIMSQSVYNRINEAKEDY